MRTLVRFTALVLLLGTLGACRSATLIQLNNEFVDLSKAQSEANKLLKEGDLDAPNYATAIEGMRARFAETGEKALAAAADAPADKPGDKASFLNLAARSYLKSGPVGEAKVDDLADQGIKTCADTRLRGLNALPVTCAYFQIVAAQAIHNQWERKRLALRSAARDARGRGQRLSAEQGKDVIDTFNNLIDALDRTQKGKERILNWNEVDESFHIWYYRQQGLIFCDARDARNLVADTVDVGPEWNRGDTATRLKATEDRWAAALKTRPGGFDAAAACRPQGAPPS